MEDIGSNGDLSKENYREWPLFKQFRQTDIFKSTFEKIFGESFDLYDERLTRNEAKAMIEQPDIISGSDDAKPNISTNTND